MLLVLSLLRIALMSVVDDYVGVSNANTHLRAAVGGSMRVLVVRCAGQQSLEVLGGTQRRRGPARPAATR